MPQNTSTDRVNPKARIVRTAMRKRRRHGRDDSLGGVD